MFIHIGLCCSCKCRVRHNSDSKMRLCRVTGVHSQWRQHGL
ncbi:hypothetical protein MAR_019747 [Mya arenaria]|uniref:Uncharacterized protein n=1 Tax=Mya arenaria TaxID=6604 RepID=A0ABY7E2V8_MYAAR|nr:hypothetical protein MAR_019747 [Mya arenaria]